MPRTYYEVASDPDRFQYFLLDDSSAFDRYTFDGRPLAQQWRPPSVYSFEPRLPEGDFWDFGLGGLGTTFAIRPEALSRPGLREYLSSVGELLPLPYHGRDFAVWNVTHCIDVLDRDASSWLHDENGERFRVDVPRFREDRLGWNVFKVPEISGSIYAWVDDVTEPPQLFMRIAEHEGLTGLAFRELYTT